MATTEKWRNVQDKLEMWRMRHGSILFLIFIFSCFLIIQRRKTTTKSSSNRRLGCEWKRWPLCVQTHTQKKSRVYPLGDLNLVFYNSRDRSSSRPSRLQTYALATHGRERISLAGLCSPYIVDNGRVCRCSGSVRESRERPGGKRRQQIM